MATRLATLKSNPTFLEGPDSIKLMNSTVWNAKIPMGSFWKE